MPLLNPNPPDSENADDADSSPPTPGYASADEEHFSDASENMASSEEQKTPSTSSTTTLTAQVVSGGSDGSVVQIADADTPATAIGNNNTKSSSPPPEEPTENSGSPASVSTKDEKNNILDTRDKDNGGNTALEWDGSQGASTEHIEAQKSNTTVDSVNVLPNIEAGVNSLEKAEDMEDSSAEVELGDSQTQSIIPDGFGPMEDEMADEGAEGGAEADDDFGDDFDDFGEVVEGGDDGFDDFESFEEGTMADFEPIPQPIATPQPPPPPPPPSIPYLPVPVIDFDDYEENEVHETVVNIVNKLYTPREEKSLRKSPKRVGTGTFLTERSESLWNQLVAPPPLQPPDWKRSRIRRLFLVSLGVPVDLDEILPASKQKKLVLPSTRSRPAQLAQSESSSAPGSRRSSTDSASGSRRGTRSKSRSRADTTPSSSSNRSGRTDKSPPVPQFDEPAARILCSTSDLVLQNMTEAELREHMRSLQALTSTASELLTYWLKKRDGAMSDKETFETVIESLVGYARKTRQGGR